MLVVCRWRPANILAEIDHATKDNFALRILAQGRGHHSGEIAPWNFTAIVTVRYTHTNLDSKVRAVGKLVGDHYNRVTVRTKMQQSVPKVSQIGREPCVEIKQIPWVRPWNDLRRFPGRCKLEEQKHRSPATSD